MKEGYEKYMEKKKMLSGKRIAEIAPAKEKHQVMGKYKNLINTSSFILPLPSEVPLTFCFLSFCFLCCLNQQRYIMGKIGVTLPHFNI